jgi:hypothetical protein
MHENEYPQSNDLVYVIIKVIVVFSYWNLRRWSLRWVTRI